MGLQRPPIDPLAALEAYRSGRYAEFLLDEGSAVPGWAWVNALAHGNVLDIASVAVAGPSPRGLAQEYRPWFRARSAMAQAVVRLTVRQGYRLRDVQQSVLLGIELELAATAGSLERGPVEITALVLEGLEASAPRA
jgi:hypothetical protein